MTEPDKVCFHALFLLGYNFQGQHSVQSFLLATVETRKFGFLHRRTPEQRCLPDVRSTTSHLAPRVPREQGSSVRSSTQLQHRSRQSAAMVTQAGTPLTLAG